MKNQNKEVTGLPHRNPIAKDLRTPKYRMRVVPKHKIYNRSKEKARFNEYL